MTFFCRSGWVCLATFPLLAQLDSRVVRIGAPPECAAPVDSVLPLRNYLQKDRPFPKVGLQCVTFGPKPSVTRDFGEVTFCGSDFNGTEQKYVAVRLGTSSAERKEALKAFACPYPTEERIVALTSIRPNTTTGADLDSVKLFGLYDGRHPGEREWHLIVRDEHVAVYVEGQLYMSDVYSSEHPGLARYPTLLMHIRVVSRTSSRLGLDLRDAAKMIYPNYWELHAGAERETIEEARNVPSQIDRAERISVIADFRAGRLAPLEKSVEYYRSLKGRWPSGYDYTGSERYLTVSMDGQLLYTDGTVVYSLSLEWRNGLGPRQSDIVMPVPIPLNAVPAGARVF
jgi:hypothetical protein